MLEGAAFIATCLALVIAWVFLRIWGTQPEPAAPPDPPATPATHHGTSDDGVTAAAAANSDGEDGAEGAGEAGAADTAAAAIATDAADGAGTVGTPESCCWQLLAALMMLVIKGAWTACLHLWRWITQVPDRFSPLPPDVQQMIAAHLTSNADRLALLRVCKAGRHAVLCGAPHVTLIFPLDLQWAVLKSRIASLSLASRLRPSQPLCVQLELAGEDDHQRNSHHASWLLQACSGSVGSNCSWDVTLKGLLLGDQLVPDYLATSCPTLSALHLVDCHVSPAAPLASQQQHGGVVHAELQHLTINGGLKPAAGGAQLSAQLLTNMLRQQLPSLPSLHSVTIQVHNAADCASMPHAGVLGPQLHSLHVVQTVNRLPAWRQALEGYTATLTHLTQLHLDSPDMLWHADMQLLLQLPTVMRLTIPEFRLLREDDTLAHLPCSWQQLRINIGSGVLDLAAFLRLPLATLQQPVQLFGRAERIRSVTSNSGSAADMQALAVHLQHCGGFSWLQGPQPFHVHGIPTARDEATSWLLAALPLLPPSLHELFLHDMEFSQPLLHALAERWASQLMRLRLFDCLLQPDACGQLLARMPCINHVFFYNYNREAHPLDRQRIHESVEEMRRVADSRHLWVSDGLQGVGATRMSYVHIWVWKSWWEAWGKGMLAVAVLSVFVAAAVWSLVLFLR